MIQLSVILNEAVAGVAFQFSINSSVLPEENTRTGILEAGFSESNKSHFKSLHLSESFSPNSWVVLRPTFSHHFISFLSFDVVLLEDWILSTVNYRVKMDSYEEKQTRDSLSNVEEKT